VKEKKREKIKNAIKIGLHYKFYEPAVDGGRRTEGGISPSNVKKRKEGRSQMSGNGLGSW
jgi:hypothetical protein